jgi:phosphoribosyl-ATP pyrophosphohydrolase
MAKSTNKKNASSARTGKKRTIKKTRKSLTASPDVLDRLWVIIDSRREVDTTLSHSAKLLARGTPQVVQKLGEELIECLIEAMAGNHAGLVTESAAGGSGAGDDVRRAARGDRPKPAFPVVPAASRYF